MELNSCWTLGIIMIFPLVLDSYSISHFQASPEKTARGRRRLSIVTMKMLSLDSISGVDDN